MMNDDSISKSSGVLVSGKRRSKLINVLNYFAIEKDGAHCLIQNCGKKLHALQNSNLKRHIVLNHPKIAMENEWMEMEDEHAKSYTIQLNKMETIKNLFQLLFDDGDPIAMIFQPNLANILKPTFDALNIKCDEEYLTTEIEKIAKNIKASIRMEIAGKMVCLKIDGASRTGRAVVGIGIQFVDKDELQTRTLSMIEIDEASTAEKLKREIFLVLNEYGINIQQVYTCTTDSGMNVFRTGEFLYEDPFDDFEIVNADIDEFLRSSVIFGQKAWTTLPIKSAVQWIQLCIVDLMQHPKFQKKLDIAREIVQGLRRKPHRSDFRDLNKALPALDQPNRWITVRKMFEALIKDRIFILRVLRKNPDLANMFETNTINFENISLLLTPILNASTELKGSQIIFGDLYKIWLEIELEISELSDMGELNEVREFMLSRMEQRKRKLFENECILGALFMDPRFSYFNSKFLTSEEKERAKCHLKKLHYNIRELMLNPKSNRDKYQPPASKFSKLEWKIRQEENTSSIDSLLHTVQLRERVPMGTDIFEYYRALRHEVDVNALAHVAFSVPATQATMERAHTGLNYILSSRRISMERAHLRNILIIKLNRELIEVPEPEPDSETEVTTVEVNNEIFRVVVKQEPVDHPPPVVIRPSRKPSVQIQAVVASPVTEEQTKCSNLPGPNLVIKMETDVQMGGSSERTDK